MLGKVARCSTDPGIYDTLVLAADCVLDVLSGNHAAIYFCLANVRCRWNNQPFLQKLVCRNLF